MEEPLSEAELDQLIGKRDPMLFIRRKEQLYKELGWGKNSPSRNEVIKTLAKHPELMTRPILVKGSKVMVGFDEKELGKMA